MFLCKKFINKTKGSSILHCIKNMEKLTIKQKKKMIEDAIILSYKTGNSSYNLIGKSLNYFDYELLLEHIKTLNKENIEQGGDDFFEYNENYPYNY